VQPPLELDEGSELLLRKALRIKDRLRHRGFTIGRYLLALLSEDRGDRRACRYRDLDYWTDRDRSAYRVADTINELQRDPRFEYRPGGLALRYRSGPQAVEVEYLDLVTHTRKSLRARRVILAAGPLGTGRIWLRSQTDAARHTLPLLCNPYRYVLCVRPRLLGRRLRSRRHSMPQLLVLHDRAGDERHVPYASILSYRSMLLFRLIQESPLAFRDSRRIMQWLHSAVNIVGVFHPDYRTTGTKSIHLAPDPESPTKDRLEIRYALTAGEIARVEADQRAMLQGLRAIGCVPIRSVDPGHGASIHYGGTLMDHIDRKRGSLTRDPCVFVADASVFGMLPGKGCALTVMAYGRWVASSARA
jgi:hypothetical protein